jgi:predicted CopG family antitoxin
MPFSGYKTVTIEEEAYNLVKNMVKLGLEESMSKALSNAIREYAEKREPLIKEIQAVRAKWDVKEA